MYAEVATLQAVLEGVPLPAAKHELMEYARTQNASAPLHLFDRLPEREFATLDEVGEALFPTQPPSGKAQAEIPHAESGQPPGGDAYTEIDPDTGRVQSD